jgi:ATP-binding cassette subfamily C (CFTR/MRP) protein 1
VLTIAHRINTIIDSDRILLLNNGELEEYDSPAALTKDPNSGLSKLITEIKNENKK